MTSNYGSYGTIQSKEKNELSFINVNDINSNMDGQEVF